MINIEKVFALTGDSDDESGLWFTSDNFKTLEKIVDKGQCVER